MKPNRFSKTGRLEGESFDGFKKSLVYIASRVHHAGIWRGFRDSGVPIVSTWIDEAGPGETVDLGELWNRIHTEIAVASKLVIYAEPDDFPLKGALVEVGMALALGVPVLVVIPGVVLDAGLRPIGSWISHPGVRVVAESIEDALRN